MDKALNTQAMIDGRLAARIREIADLETDSELLSGPEKRRILYIAADRLEDYILQVTS